MRRTVSSIISAACVLGGLFPAAAQASTLSTPYSDIAGNFAYKDIVDMTDLGYMHGYADGTFQPNQLVTRGQFLAYLMNALHPLTHVAPRATRQFYVDVSPGNWDYAFVGAAETAGWIKPNWVGVRTGGFFNENYQASRGDAASFFVAALEGSPIHLRLPSGMSPLAYANSIGLFAGIPSSQGNVYLTRAGAAMTLSHMLSWIKSPLVQSQVAKAQVLLPPTASSHSGTSQASNQPGAAASALTASPTQATPSATVGKTPVILGWNYGGTVASFLAEDATATPINTFVYDGFHLTPSQTFVGSPGMVYADTLHARGKKAWAMFGNSMNESLTTQALSTPTSRAHLVSQMVSLSLADHFDGVNIDFENVAGSDRANFTAFVDAAAAALHAKHLLLSVDVSTPSAGAWSAAYDYKRLAAAVDYVAVMTYDEHWSGDPSPGPVASVPWVKQSIQDLLPDIPKSKFLLGIPLYTRGWDISSPTQTQSRTLAWLEQLIANHGVTSSVADPATGQTIDRYTGPNGALWELWQDGPHTLHNIAALQSTDGLAGLAFWQLGYETPNDWKIILP